MKNKAQFLQSPSEQTAALTQKCLPTLRIPMDSADVSVQATTEEMIIQLRFPFISYSTQALFRVVRPLKQMSPSCWACRHSSLSSWLLRDGPCIPTRGPEAFIPAGQAAVPQPPTATSLRASPFSLLCSLPSVALAAIPDLRQASVSQLCPRIFMYSSGTRSGSTGLGKKWVNFWCRLDLVPSLGVPSLFNATK